MDTSDGSIAKAPSVLTSCIGTFCQNEVFTCRVCVRKSVSCSRQKKTSDKHLGFCHRANASDDSFRVLRRRLCAVGQRVLRLRR
eukprot:1443797-Amphidinium_carterae.1